MNKMTVEELDKLRDIELLKLNNTIDRLIKANNINLEYSSPLIDKKFSQRTKIVSDEVSDIELHLVSSSKVSLFNILTDIYFTLYDEGEYIMSVSNFERGYGEAEEKIMILLEKHFERGNHEDIFEFLSDIF